MRSPRYFGSLCFLWIAGRSSFAQTTTKRPLNLDDVLPLARAQRRARKSGFSTAAAEKLASSLT
jgi:hypothetical protein